MARFTNPSLDKLRDAVDIVDLINGYTDLRRAGSQYTGLCPFHEERTPSFSVNPTEKLYYCFGCQEGGDAIGFVQKAESLDFAQTIEWLADRYGVELEYEELDPKEAERQKQRERLYELLERATKFYERTLAESDEAGPAREYLKDRGFSPEVLAKFRVGYSPKAWDKLFVPALRQGFTEQELLAAGLAQRNDRGQIYDRFRGRVMFPLSDPRGRVRGFGARAMRDGDRPKYLNSADGPVYQKGRQLFGANHARSVAAKRGRVIAVEGYADVLALHDAGIEESVAVMGTAMTDEQVVELARLASRIYLALDADRAGRQAMIRAARVADRHGIELLVVDLPAGKDPADLIAEGGAEAFEDRVRKALTVVEFEIAQTLAAADLDSARGRDAAIAELQPIFELIPIGAVKDEQIRLVADKLKVSENALAGLRNVRVKHDRQAAGNAIVPGAAIPESEKSERLFFASCLSSRAVGPEYLEKLTNDLLSTPLMRELRDHLQKNFEKPLAGAASLKPELRDAVTEVAMLSERENASPKAIQLGFLQLEKAGLERALAGSAASDKAKIELKRQEVIKQLGELTAEFA
ncbi:MAG: DNA primase [Actinobacteria bacterium]|nr:DNA primase [Actinomycetota bacterium]